MMIYDIKLKIRHDYANAAIGGRHVICVAPQSGPGQQVEGLRITISPAPSDRTERIDFFGNRLTEFAIRDATDHLALQVTARVTRTASAPQIGQSLRLSGLPGVLAEWRGMQALSPVHFLAASARVPMVPEIDHFARDHRSVTGSVAETVIALGEALHHHMRFDPTATTVETPAALAFAQRRGVCQDYSHIMLAGLRGLGIPAGYVSGFLRTSPPPGKPRLEGADAMHAWVMAWCGPELGWVDYDPTNACMVGTDHITVARGRDYSDVAPVRGMMRLSGGQKSSQAVDVIPVGP